MAKGKFGHMHYSWYQKGYGKVSGTCPEKHLCHSNGECKPYCRVNGILGNGTTRGNCEMDQVCWGDGVCRAGKQTSSSYMRAHILRYSLIFCHDYY